MLIMRELVVEFIGSLNTTCPTAQLRSSLSIFAHNDCAKLLVQNHISPFLCL